MVLECCQKGVREMCEPPTQKKNYEKLNGTFSFENEISSGLAQKSIKKKRKSWSSSTCEFRYVVKAWVCIIFCNNERTKVFFIRKRQRRK